MELINPLATPPTVESIRAKHRWVLRGLALLVFSLLMAVGGGLILATMS